MQNSPSTEVMSLEAFLQLPNIEESPAWEFVDGTATQKPMPKTRHSLLQKRLLTEIDPDSSQYAVLPELRCTFGGRSIVPDVAVITWSRIPINEAGEPEDNFTEAPNWSIEILSPKRKVTRVIDSLLHCLNYGCQLGWLIDPDDCSVLVVLPQQQPVIYRDDRSLPVLPGINATFTPRLLFSWLQFRRF